MNYFTKSKWGFCAVLLLLLCATAGLPQNTSSAADETTTTGVMVSSTRNTLTVRTDDGNHRLFVVDRNTVRPASISKGERVRVVSIASDDPSVRVARIISLEEANRNQAAVRGETSDQAGSATAPRSQADVVPPEIRQVENDIEREVRRYQGGVRAGVALDPELVMIGIQAQVGPFFNSNTYLRPNIEFGFGEVTALFGLNLEAIYRLPTSSNTGRWSSYVGIGPGFNFIHQSFARQNGGSRIDFGDFRSDTALNILGGIRYRSGLFGELRTSIYSDPAPRFRLIIGYNF
jgi:hypothetical protein